MDKLLNDVQKLKNGQILVGDLGYGALAAGLVALVGVVYLIVRIKMVNKNVNGPLAKNKNETTRVL